MVLVFKAIVTLLLFEKGLLELAHLVSVRVHLLFVVLEVVKSVLRLVKLLFQVCVKLRLVRCVLLEHCILLLGLLTLLNELEHFLFNLEFLTFKVDQLLLELLVLLVC